MTKKRKETKKAIANLKSAVEELESNLFRALVDLRDILLNGPDSEFVCEMDPDASHVLGPTIHSLLALFEEILEEVYRADYQFLQVELCKASRFEVFREVAYLLLLPHPEVSRDAKTKLLRHSGLIKMLDELALSPSELVQEIGWQRQLEEVLKKRFGHPGCQSGIGSTL